MASEIFSHANFLIVASIAVWWTANTLTAISSKDLMNTSNVNRHIWSEAIQDFRWLELTFLQHLLGAIVSILWIKVAMRKSIWPSAAESSRKAILLASIGNVAGNMATNVAYALVSSSMTQVVKSCEPLFMFGLSLLLYRDTRVLTFTTFLTIIVMVIGAALFEAADSTFLLSGLLAAICSNIAFPIRNIFLRKLTNVWDNAVQKYAVISLYSVLVLTPVIIMKQVKLPSISLLSNWYDGLISSSFHCIYNLTSIYVLQNFSPLSHSILNLLKRGIVITANLSYFHTPISINMIFGLAGVMLGLYFYLRQSNKIYFPSLATLLTYATIGSYLFFSQSTGVSERFPIISTRAFIQANEIPVVDTTPAKVVRSAWVYDRPVSENVLANLLNLTKHSNMIMYCGTSECMRTINALSNKRISTEFLNIRNLLQDMPLEKWLDKHTLYKVLALTSFEHHLQEVVKLGILWKYGGVYIEPNVQFEEIYATPFQSCTKKPWIKLPFKKNCLQLFHLACFPSQHPFIENVSAMIVKEYYSNRLVDTGKYNLNTEGISITTLQFNLLPLEADTHHYGTLSYSSRVLVALGANVGDEIQGFAGLQFLPFLDNFVERDRLFSSKSEQKITTFFNAWWGSSIAQWPPPPNIDPLLFSINIAPDMHSQWKRSPNYIKERSPIGCRDYGTLKFLSTLDVPSYFSGCMTLTLQRKSERNDQIYIVDVKEKYIKMLPNEIKKKSVRIYHNLGFNFNLEDRSTKAFELIDKYSKAKLVITQRIHCALPCVAMGIPVIFINSASMPGGGGTSQGSSLRTLGLTSMFHTFDNYKMAVEEAQEWFAKFPWDDPPPNPDMATMMRLRATFWYQIRQREPLYDSARKFGLIPMSLPSPCLDRLQFHMHFQQLDKHFTWQDHRSIESILRHHPCADVLIHSNTLDNKRFDVFRESGYQIQVIQYHFNQLAKDTLLESSLSSKIGDSQQKDLFPLVVLYKWGGIYMDSHIILTQSLESQPPNFVFQRKLDDSKMDVSLSLMGFEKQNKHLEQLMIEYISNVPFQNDISKFLAQTLNNDDSVSKIEWDKFFPSIKQCQTINDSFSNVTESAIAVSLPTDHSFMDTIGTVPLLPESSCQQALQNYCVICCKLL